jgi:hypothetical protein
VCVWDDPLADFIHIASTYSVLKTHGAALDTTRHIAALLPIHLQNSIIQWQQPSSSQAAAKQQPSSSQAAAKQQPNSSQTATTVLAGHI